MFRYEEYLNRLDLREVRSIQSQSIEMLNRLVSIDFQTCAGSVWKAIPTVIFVNHEKYSRLKSLSESIDR
jgi:hypothetical protein